jgi:branched-chain amino acid transport system permease protein
MELTLSTFVIQALHGLVYGMLLFLVASGLTLVFGMMDVLNIAHAAFYMLGAYLGSTVLVLTGHFWLALILAPIAVGLLGALVERYFLRKVHIHGHAFELLITFGVFFVIGEVVKWVWGNFPRPMDVPSILAGSVHMLGFTYPLYRFFILVVSLIVLGALLFVFLKTRVGIRIRAAVSDGPMVNALGVNVPRLFLGVFSGGAALAELGG